MKNKKAISIILSLSAIFGTFGAVPASAEGSFTIASGYQFVDIAHHGDTYVAFAKNSSDNWTAAKLYTSTDGGMTWKSTRDISGANVSANPKSQQQLVYWKEKGIFVAHCAGATLTSADGSTWDNLKTLHNSSNEVITVSGDQLILSCTNALIATNDTSVDKVTDAEAGSHKLDMSGSSYPKAVGAKPADASGNISILINNQNTLYDVTLNVSEGEYTYTQGNSNSGTAIPEYPLDMVYSAKADQFLAVYGSTALFTAKNSQSFASVTVREGVNVTGVAASDDYIVVGMENGKIYYTDNAEITAATEWTEIPVAAGKAAATEPIKNIEFSDDGKSFVALSETQIYKGNISKYSNIDEYVEEYCNIGNPEIAGEAEINPFDGVRLIGGTYSDTLGKYIVYGDTTSKLADENGNEKYWGMIFTSDNGTNWSRVYQGYTFSQRNLDTDGITIKSYNEVRNGAVWWQTEGKFIISASTQDHSGVSLVSEDGQNWKAVLPSGNKDADGNAQTGLDTDFRLNTDIVIGGDKLYTTNNGRQFRTYTAWNSASMTWFGVTNVPNTWYMNQIAVSNDADPAVLMAQNANGVVRNNDSQDEIELNKWTRIDALGGAGSLRDAVFSENLNKFVAVLTTGNKTSIISKDGTVVQGPAVSAVFNAIDTNGEAFMFAGNDGNVYTAPDTADFSKDNTALTAVPSANGKANTMNVTNVFKAGDKFIATASNNTNSDVLVISKKSNGTYEYVTVSSLLSKGELVPGGTVTVSVDVQNQMPDECNFTIIAAIFKSDDRFAQVVAEDKTVGRFTDNTETMTVDVDTDIPAGSYMRVFVWNSLDGMVPITDVSTPFN